MLATETYSLDDALAEIEERRGELADELDDLDTGTDAYQDAKARHDRLGYLARGLRWQRDEEDWGDAEIELGALTAGEKAMMHREAPDAADGEEMRLWFVAASTITAPYAGDDLSETFSNLANCHPAFAEWVEAKANSLGIPDAVGNGSSTSSTESGTSDEATSTDAPSTST